MIAAHPNRPAAPARMTPDLVAPTLITIDAPISRFLLLLGLGFFFGLAFEEFYARAGQARPGGIRSFPLLALAGGLLYRLDPQRLLPFCAGLLVLGAWLTVYYWRHAGETDAKGTPNVGLVVPVCNLLAFALGPTALAGPPWLAVGASVAAVLLLTAREQLHGLARRIGIGEIVTAGKFLLLTGLVLPLLPDHPVTTLTSLTPRLVWLAVLAVCTLSYASYLLQRYVAPKGAGLWVAGLGGFYSSTATTVVLARRAAAEPAALAQAQTGIVLATSVMYLRMLAMILVFNRPLAAALAPVLLGLSAAGLALAGAWWWWAGRRKAEPGAAPPPANPLELGASLVFAALFVAISLASAWARATFGAAGVYLLAAIVGVADVDPFVLSMAEHGPAQLPVAEAAVAILIAASSNNILKAGYAMAFAGPRASAAPVAILAALALAGVAVAARIAGLW